MTYRIFPLSPAFIAVAAMTSLTACGEADAPESMNQQEMTEALNQVEAPPPPPAADQDDQAAPAGEDEDEAGATLPQPGAFRFVGYWAAEAEMCPDKAWRFTREVMETPAGSVCKFVNATPVDGGYDISARCTAEGPPVDDMLTIRFAESAQAMLFESESVADAGLIYCGPLDRAG